MRYRIMRLMVMFDLPVETSENRRNYRKFRKALINEGFLMIQFSVYVRVCVNKKSADSVKGLILSRSPENQSDDCKRGTESGADVCHRIKRVTQTERTVARLVLDGMSRLMCRNPHRRYGRA